MSSAGSPGSALPWWLTFRRSVGPRPSAPQDAGLGIRGEQDAHARAAHEQDDGPVVRVAGAAGHAGPGRWPEHLHGGRTDAQSLSGPRRDQRRPALDRRAREVLALPFADAVAAVQDAADRQLAQHPVRAPDVVGLRMRADEHVEPPDAELAQAREHGAARGAAVDEHGVAARLDERRIALPDVEERHPQHARRRRRRAAPRPSARTQIATAITAIGVSTPRTPRERGASTATPTAVTTTATGSTPASTCAPGRPAHQRPTASTRAVGGPAATAASARRRP